MLKSGKEIRPENCLTNRKLTWRFSWIFVTSNRMKSHRTHFVAFVCVEMEMMGPALKIQVVSYLFTRFTHLDKW